MVAVSVTVISLCWDAIGIWAPPSVYPITYNNLTDQNKEDLKTNIGKKLGLSEYFVRINPVYNVFTNAETVAIRKG